MWAGDVREQVKEGIEDPGFSPQTKSFFSYRLLQSQEERRHLILQVTCLL
jgi:hypothetical protein